MIPWSVWQGDHVSVISGLPYRKNIFLDTCPTDMTILIAVIAPQQATTAERINNRIIRRDIPS